MLAFRAKFGGFRQHGRGTIGLTHRGDGQTQNKRRVLFTGARNGLRLMPGTGGEECC
jgi:hypothetical protein